jgi:FAD/FMN-containing dehydrogenase
VTGALASELADVVGPAHVLTARDVVAGYEVDWTGRWHGRASLVVRPGTAEEVAAVLRACAARPIPVVAQGGNTGLVGGAVPFDAVVLSTTRLSELQPVDEGSAQMTVGAGVTLSALQQHAEGAGLAFAVDLAARDTATVGGMVATNAGGLHVLRHGPMRAQVAGLEAVLPDGRVISRLAGLLKDNTGYDLSGLLVGSEGTLAIVTSARLRLVPPPAARVTALLGVSGTEEAVARTASVWRAGIGLEAAELFYDDGLALVCSMTGLAPPFGRRRPPAYLLLECAGPQDPTAALAELVADAADSAVAGDARGRAALWAYRERHTEAIGAIGVPHKLDVSVPPGVLPRFAAEARRLIEAAGARAVLFGHVADGNLHVNVVGPDPEDNTLDGAVLRAAVRHGGTISAEHGIGRAKTPWLELSRSPAELATMTAIKAAFDPAGLLNPGVLLPGPPAG